MSCMSDSRSEGELEQLLDFLKRNRGFDFTGYKRASLARRVAKRMQTANVSGFADYIAYLEVHPPEFVALFDAILISVTSFFRDEGTWEYLAQHVLPELASRKTKSGHLRVWSAGCASGQEVYTLTMLLAEQFGMDGFKDRVKVYGTDVDRHALAKARQGTYSPHDVRRVPEALLAKYFEPSNGHYTFREDLRRQLTFGHHDLISDAPIPRVDLLVCRNTLMYMTSETQAKILARFHVALNDGGILMLGRAETARQQATFTPIDFKRRISSKGRGPESPSAIASC
jgi:two-component system CheB/CheR fusion protein